LSGKSIPGRDTYVEQNNDGVPALLQGDWKYMEPARGPALLQGVDIASGLYLQPQMKTIRNLTCKRVCL
ncbi:MAG TPA: hypothetical protein VGC22_07280, partial [Chitinophaga sp.]